MVSWSTIQSLLIFFGPILLPRILAFYRSLRAPSTIRPIPLNRPASIALNILLATAVLFLASTTPLLSPDNIFIKTQSRLQTPTNVLFTRLASISDGPISPSDARLRSVFEKGGLEARLLYLRFGPAVLSTCSFVDPRDAGASAVYLFYALPAIAAAHVAHVLVLGLVTSTAVTGVDGGRWRVLAAIAGVVMGVAEVWSVWGYDHQLNSKAAKLGDLDFFYWKVRLVRGLACAGLDAGLGWLIWLGATKRAFIKPVSGAEKVEEMTKGVEGLLGKARGLATVRNVVYRSPAMRGNVERYWVHEEQMMRSVVEDRDVVRAMTEVLGNVDIDKLSKEAKGYVDSMLPDVQLAQGS